MRSLSIWIICSRKLFAGEVLLLLVDTSGFAGAIAKVAQLGAANAARADSFDLGDVRRMQRVNFFNRDTLGDFADGKRRASSAAAAATTHNHTLENLDAFLVAFHDLLMNRDGVPGSEIGFLLEEIFRLNFLNDVHFYPPIKLIIKIMSAGDALDHGAIVV